MQLYGTIYDVIQSRRGRVHVHAPACLRQLGTSVSLPRPAPSPGRAVRAVVLRDGARQPGLRDGTRPPAGRVPAGAERQRPRRAVPDGRLRRRVGARRRRVGPERTRRRRRRRRSRRRRRRRVVELHRPPARRPLALAQVSCGQFTPPDIDTVELSSHVGRCEFVTHAGAVVQPWLYGDQLRP